MAPTARARVVLFVLVVVAAVAHRLVLAGGAGPEWPAPVRREVAGDELVHLVERGMGDPSRYLKRHAAFAAYLSQRTARAGTRGAETTPKLRTERYPRERKAATVTG